MEKRYIVSDSPVGCLLSTACSAVGAIVGGWWAHMLFVTGWNGWLAAGLFLAVMVVCQLPAIVVMQRRRRLRL